MRASVIGREFDLGVLAATSTRSEEHVRLALREACRLQLLIERGDRRYSFRHALTRDIIYSEFLETRTRPIHRRIARVLEGLQHAREVSLEELAYHAWAGGDVRRALRYNEIAGDNAAAVHASTDAQRYYARARSLIEMDSAAYRRLTEKLDAVGGE
jgi:predicted ATPase